uniref:Cell division protein n=1 Tax=Chaetophoropsis pisiformis TaxID=1675661 RepID=A0A6M3U877_9CHLO|nr:cell division protein [Chaetophoropsis pisiformis]
MFNNNSILIKKTKVLLLLKHRQKTQILIPNSFPFSMKNINQAKPLNNKTFYYNPKKSTKLYSVDSYFNLQRGNSQEKMPIRSIVKNQVIDWHCTKPIGKNELGLWFSLITQPFSTRKHWWILLPAQNLVFRLRWERFQSRELRLPQITNVPSLNWFSEKPIYFYVVIPFLGCLGLISASLPNDGTDFKRKAFFSDQSKTLDSSKMLSQISSNWLNSGQDLYIGTYFDSQSYFKFLNSLNLVQNLKLDLFHQGKADSKNLSSFNPEGYASRPDFGWKTTVPLKKSGKKNIPGLFTGWDQYLFQKSKIYWFWSNWALKDFSLLKEENSRLIWQKFNSSTMFKINCKEKTNSDSLFLNRFSFPKNIILSSFSFSDQIKDIKTDFAQKVFSTDLNFPKKILTNWQKSENQTNFSIQANKMQKLRSITQTFPEGTSKEKELRSFSFRTLSLLSTQSFYRKKDSSGNFNFILINGFTKKLRNKKDTVPFISQFEKTKIEYKHKLSCLKSSNDLLEKNSIKVYAQMEDLQKKEFYNLFGLVHLNKRSNFFSNFSPPFDFSSKYFTTAFFLDSVFTQLYSYKQFPFLKSSFTPQTYRISRNLELWENLRTGKTKVFPEPITRISQPNFKKLNFPILLAGHINSDQMLFSSRTQVFDFQKIKKTKYGIFFGDNVKEKGKAVHGYSNFENKVGKQSQFTLINTFIRNMKKNKSYSTNFKWRSVGNWSFYWNYFKHFYGASNLLKPWSSTFDSLIIQKPSKNIISNILFKKFYSPFSSVNVFPDHNFMFNKWHSKKKQGFFYKRITKLELKKRTSQTSYSRVVSLLWGFRAKYKLDEVLQYQKSKYYQSKKAQQTAHQNFNQNSTSNNINNQMMIKTLTKRRRYKKYLEFNVLSSWLRDVIYFKKMARKLIKIKKDTYFFNQSNVTNRVPEISRLQKSELLKNIRKKSSLDKERHRFYKDTRESKAAKNSLILGRHENFDFLQNSSNRMEFLQSSNKSKKKDQVFPFHKYAKKFSKVKKLEKESILPVHYSLYIKKGSTNDLYFETDFLKSESLHTSKTLFMVLNKFYNLNKFQQLNQSSNLFEPYIFFNNSQLNHFQSKMGWTPCSFSVNKTPIFLKKIAFNSSNKRFLQAYRKDHLKIFKNFHIFFDNFQKIIKKGDEIVKKKAPLFFFTISSPFFFQSPLVNSVKHIKPMHTNVIHSFTKINTHLFVQQSLLSNKHILEKKKSSALVLSNKVGQEKLRDWENLRFLKKSSIFLKGKTLVFPEPRTQLSTKLKTNIKTSLLNKIFNFSPTLYKPFQLSSPFIFEKRRIQPLISSHNKVSELIGGKFLSVDDLILKFKNLSSSFVIWRNKFQIRRDYLLLSYFYLDYLGTLINSFNSSRDFLPFVTTNENLTSTLSSDFEIKSNYFIQSELYKTNLIKPFWSFSIINHLKNNHIGVYDQLLNSSNDFVNQTNGSKLAFFAKSTDISYLGVLPKKSISSLSNFWQTNSTVLFNRSIKSPTDKSFKGSAKKYWDKNEKVKQSYSTTLFSFPDSTTFNKNYLNYKTKLFNQKLILLKKQKLISVFSTGFKQVKLRVKKQKSIEWTQFKYRRKPGISKSRIANKQTKIYNGILFQNLVHTEHFEERLASAKKIGDFFRTHFFLSHGSVQNLTFWLCTIVFHLCLVSSLITNYKVSFHFCLKTLYSFVFILNKYLVYAKYRLQRLITYIYRNNFENFIENIGLGSARSSFSMLKKQSLGMVNKMNFSITQSGTIFAREAKFLFRSSVQTFPYSGFLSSSFKTIQNTSQLKSFSKISVNKNSFSKLFFLPYFYAASSKIRKDSSLISSLDNNSSSLMFYNSFDHFKLKLLTLFQYIQFKYDTPFSNFQYKDVLSVLLPKQTKPVALLDQFKGFSTKVDFKDLQLDSNFQAQRTTLNKNLLQLAGSEQITSGFWFWVLGKLKFSQSVSFPRTQKSASKKISDFFSRNNLPVAGSETNIKLYFKALKWNTVLTLALGESEVLAELEPYREMHWYFLKKFPIFLRTSATKDYLNMVDYQADEKIRIIKQKIRQTIMILYLRTKKYESKLQNRVTQTDKNINYLVRNRLNQKKVSSNLETKDSTQQASARFDIFRVFTDSKIRRRKIKKISFWKSILTFLGKYSFLSRSAILSKRFRESLMLFSYPLVTFGPIGTIFLPYAVKKFTLDFEQNFYQKSKLNSKMSLQPVLRFSPEISKKRNLDNNTLFSSFLRVSQTKNSCSDHELAKLNSYIFKKITKQIKFELRLERNTQSFFDLEFFTDSQKFVKKYNRIYLSVTNTLNKTYPGVNNPYNTNIMNSSLQITNSRNHMQILKLNDLYDWSYTERSNTLGKNSIYSDTFDPKLRYYRFSTNFSKVLADVGGFYTSISAQQELGPIICKVYTGLFAKQSAKNYLVVSGSTNHESVLLLIQALSAEMGMKLFIEDAKRLQRIGRRGINKATKRLEKLFDIAQANSPALIFIEDIHVIGGKTKMVKVDEEHDDVEILSRSLLSKLVYRKYHRNKSLRESFIDQNLFTGGSSSTRRRSLKPSNPIPTSLVLYQLTRRRALSNFFKSQENPARRLNNKLFLSKKLSPAFTTNAVLIWKLFKSKIATPNKRIKETPWYHIPIDAMRSINPLTYSIRVKVAKITLLAIFTMGTRLRLVKDLIRLFEKIQFESYQNLIVFATTNKLSTLDPNLRRPGRLEETISLEGLTGTVSSSRSPAFMAILDTFKVHLKSVPGFSKTFNIIDNTLFSTNLNLQEWTVINYLAENAYYSLDRFKNNCVMTNFTLSNPNSNYSNKMLNYSLFFEKQREKRIQLEQLNSTTTLKFLRLSQNQRMTNFSTKNRINSPFSFISNQNSGSNSISNYWQSLFSNILLHKKTGLFTLNHIFNFSKIDKFNLFLIFAYSRSGQSLVSFLLKQSLLKNQRWLFLENNRFSKPSTISRESLPSSVSLPSPATSLIFDSDYLINLQLWPEIVNLMSLKKSNLFYKRKQSLHSSFFRFFASKVGELIFSNSVIWTTPKTRESSNTPTFFNIMQNRGFSNIYNTKASWSGAYASIKNVVTTSALYSKTPLLSKLLHLEDISKPRQKSFFESLNAGMLFEYSDFHYRAFFKKNTFSTEENLNLLIYQKYMLNNQGRPLRKYVKLEHSNRLWLFRILYTELGSLDNLTLNPTSMNYYYRNKIALKQVFKLSSYQWWNWHLRKPLDQLEDIQEIAYFPCENKYYTPRRRRWILTNGSWGYWFSFDKNFYFELYEQYMLQSLHFAYLQLDKNREVLDYLAKLYIYKEKLSETDIIFALKRYQI